jgi:hypothetical protein
MNEKRFTIPKEEMRRLVPPMGWCFATDSILVDGKEVGYMYRKSPDRDGDSGWRFFAGDEPQDYANDPEHLGMYDVNTVANYDPDIISYLDVPPPCAFGKVVGSHEYHREDC